MRGFFAFCISFLILILVWSEQHRFFRRYRLEDNWILSLNVTLLLIELFYVYPHKFLFSLLFSDPAFGKKSAAMKITQQQVPLLFLIYALGYLVIYSLLFLLYLHASRQSKELELSSRGYFDCKTNIYKQAIMVSIGFVSVLIAMPVPYNMAGLAGFIYFFFGPALAVFYSQRNKARKKSLT